MHPLRLAALPGLRRARARVAAVLAETPLLFFAVVLGVALAFRVVIDVVRALP